MNENAKKWVEALRSGEYQQTQGTLRNMRRGDSYCCLGVACEIYRKEFGGEWLDLDEDGWPYFLDRSANLPDDVQGWLGLKTSTGSFGDGDASLAGRNDDGASFDEIADLIESKPKGLFA